MKTENEYAEITKEDFIKAFNSIPNSIPKQEYILTYPKSMWIAIRPIYNWTDEELDNAVNGYIGTKNSIKCYITPF